MLMWGQPPSAVRSSEARRVLPRGLANANITHVRPSPPLAETCKLSAPPFGEYSMANLRIGFLVLALGSVFFGLSLAHAQQPTAANSEPVLDVTSMDQTVDPCADFFQYSCGGWIKKNPIPADQSSWDTYSKMQDENTARLRGILEEAAV